MVQIRSNSIILFLLNSCFLLLFSLLCTLKLHFTQTASSTIWRKSTMTVTAEIVHSRDEMCDSPTPHTTRCHALHFLIAWHTALQLSRFQSHLVELPKLEFRNSTHGCMDARMPRRRLRRMDLTGKPVVLNQPD